MRCQPNAGILPYPQLYRSSPSFKNIITRILMRGAINWSAISEAVSSRAVVE